MRRTRRPGFDITPNVGHSARCHPDDEPDENLRRDAGYPAARRGDRRAAAASIFTDGSLRWTGLTARGASPSAFDRRCIPPGCVTRHSNRPYSRVSRLASRAHPGLGATTHLHHGLLGGAIRTPDPGPRRSPRRRSAAGRRRLAVNRQRQRAAGSLQRAGTVPSRSRGSEALLFVERHRIVDGVTNAASVSGPWRCLVAAPECMLVEDVIPLASATGRVTRSVNPVLEQLGVAICVAPATFGPPSQSRQLDSKHGRLQRGGNCRRSRW